LGDFLYDHWLMEKILLVEDKAELRQMLAEALARMGYSATPVGDAEAAMPALKEQHFSAVLTDLKLPQATGMDVMRAALAADDSIPVIIMTAYGTIAEAVSAMRDGAYDFIQKPIDLEHLRHLLARAIERQQLLRENLVLKDEYARKFGFPRMIGEHPSMLAAGREMQRIAPTDSSVLLLGESGTGKELFARAIHQMSLRAGKPFVALNCAAIPESLVENELFGHERGAFTGADSRQPGKFHLAHGGAIFLDEIGELPLAVQAKLLRVLEGGKIQRLGGSSEITVDVRIIAATNRDLESAVESQQFRRDLFYRLAVMPIRIPALRERGDDILLLAEHFLSRFRKELKKPRLKLSRPALDALRRHTWPGNVRELQNVMERAAILSDGELNVEDLALPPLAKEKEAPAQGRDPKTVETPAEERRHIESVLRECKWNKRAAAERLGMPYKTLLHRLRSYDAT
jgi:DNA-binding NtrC family response regulator